MNKQEINVNEVVKEMSKKIWNRRDNDHDAYVSFVENNGEYSIKANAFVDDDDNVIYELDIDKIVASISAHVIIKDMYSDEEQFIDAWNEENCEIDYEDVTEEDIEKLAVLDYARDLEEALAD